MLGKVLKQKSISGGTLLLVERYCDFRKLLIEQAENIAYVGTKTIGLDVFFTITLKKDIEI